MRDDKQKSRDTHDATLTLSNSAPMDKSTHNAFLVYAVTGFYMTQTESHGPNILPDKYYDSGFHDHSKQKRHIPSGELVAHFKVNFHRITS